MKLYLIAGEASGDLHGSNLAKGLLALQPALQLRGMGGDRMAEAGVALSRHYSTANFMGFAEVLGHLPTILKLFSFIEADVEAYNPDALILIDYPGFNLRLARTLKKQKRRIFYYISPQLWAWKKGRVKQIKAFVEQMLVILPFEKDFYAKEGLRVDYVGHPLLDALAQVETLPNTLVKDLLLDERPVIALLPGSRAQEIKRMLPVMLAAATPFAKEYQILIAGAPGQQPSFYAEIIGEEPAKLVMNRSYDLLRLAKAALVTSGTATLETALLGVPEAICYRAGTLSYLIARAVIKLKFIGLVNLVMGRAIVKEFIQGRMNPQGLKTELVKLLEDESYRNRIKTDYDELRHKLGDAGASTTAAAKILGYLNHPKP